MPIKAILKKHGIEEKIAEEIASEIFNLHKIAFDELTEHFQIIVNRYRSIIHSDLPIVMTGTDLKTIIECTDGAVSYFGFSRDEVINKDARALYYHPSVRENIEDDLKGKKIVIRDVKFKTKGGKLKTAQVHIDPIMKDYAEIIGTIGIVIDKSREKELEKKVVNNFLGSLRIQIDALEGRHPEFKGHSKQVAEYVCDFIEKEHDKLARIFDPQIIDYYVKQIELIKTYVRLHDYGKVDITTSEIRNPERYEAGRNPVARHAAQGDEMMKTYLENLEYTYDEDLRAIIRYHHERWDGNGYPDRLKGNQIPLIARVVNIFDAVQAMESERVYKKEKKTTNEIVDELKECAGTQFDPGLVPLAIDYILEKENWI